jgi:hypothetical protein
MRLIIQPNYDSISEWVAHYVASRIKEYAPNNQKKICTWVANRFFPHLECTKN